MDSHAADGTFDDLGRVQKALKHARIKRDRVPKGATEAKQKAEERVTALEKQRDELYEKLGRRTASKLEDAQADHGSGADLVRKAMSMIQTGLSRMEGAQRDTMAAASNPSGSSPTEDSTAEGSAPELDEHRGKKRKGATPPEAKSASAQRQRTTASNSTSNIVQTPSIPSSPAVSCQLSLLRRVREDLEIWIVPRFAQEVLGFDPADLMTSLQKYPKVGEGGAIVPHRVQWVDGENKALNYRGGPVKINKIWLQRGDPSTIGTIRYWYTGWQWAILPATADVAACPEVLPIAGRYDNWVTQQGYPKANHYIITEYSDGDHHIGYHYDKPQSIHAKSLITVVKTGEHGRPFQLRDRVSVTSEAGEDKEALKARQKRELRAHKGDKRELKGQHKKALDELNDKQNKAQDAIAAFFDEIVEPGTAIIMTVRANLRTQHGVPETPDSGPSGSLCFRTITESVPPGTKKVVKI